MSKIKTYENMTVVLPDGSDIEITESSDGTYNVRVNDYSGESIRVGIEGESGIEYRYWRDINKRECYSTASK